MVHRMLLKTIDIYFASRDKKTFSNIVDMEMVNTRQMKLVDWEGKIFLVNWENVNFVVYTEVEV